MVRQLLDIFIFLAQRMVLTFCLSVVVVWLLSRLLAGRHRVLSPPKYWLVAGSGVVLATFVAIGCWYVRAGGFAGEVEPVVSCLSWLVERGRPLYTGFDAAERYSVLYGPSVFLTNGLFLRILGPSLASAKLASICGGVGSLVFLYASLVGRRRKLVALGVTTLAALYYWTQGFAVYLVRPDALMLFAVGLGVYGATRNRHWLAVLTLAATAGFAVNLKAHGAIYFGPVFLLLWRRFGTRAVLWAMLGTSVVVISPFFLYSQVSLINYVGWLRNAVSHGLDTSMLGQTLRYAGFLLLPLLALILASPDRRQLGRKFRLELMVLAPVYGVTLVLAAKPGAGPVHLLPLVPTTMYLLGTILQESHVPVWEGSLSRVILAAAVSTALLAGSVNAYRSVRFVAYEISQTPQLAQDLNRIMARYPGLSISMACGGENLSFQTTWLRPLLVFADNPLLIDPISVMDSSLSGRDLSPRTYQAITDGRVAVWLVPRRQIPFAKENWYAPHKPLFPDRFREHFTACYSLQGHSRYFDLWFWNGLPADAQGEAVYAGGDGGTGTALAP